MPLQSSIQVLILLELLSYITFSKTENNVCTVFDVNFFINLRDLQWLTYRTTVTDKKFSSGG
jgi:hypothetical protein